MKTGIYAAIKAVQGRIEGVPVAVTGNTEDEAIAAANARWNYGQFDLCAEIEAHRDTETGEVICFANNKRVYIDPAVSQTISAMIDASAQKQTPTPAAMTFDQAIEHCKSIGAYAVVANEYGEWRFCDSSGCGLEVVARTDKSDYRQWFA